MRRGSDRLGSAGASGGAGAGRLAVLLALVMGVAAASGCGSKRILVPARTPAPIVSRLNTEVRKIVASDDVRHKFEPQGVEPDSTTPEEFSAFLRSEAAKWAKVVKGAGLRAD